LFPDFFTYFRVRVAKDNGTPPHGIIDIFNTIRIIYSGPLPAGKNDGKFPGQVIFTQRSAGEDVP
jgi:hypothetical protein